MLERESERYKGKAKSLEAQPVRSREEQGRLRGVVVEKASELGVVRRVLGALRRTGMAGEELGVVEGMIMNNQISGLLLSWRNRRPR